jgi:hypothetical protein
MSIYTTNIPQATDNPSQSQSQLLGNFNTLNNLYGVDGDHYPWTDTNSTEEGLHAKVTMPGLPTTNAPGNALPTTFAGQDAIFSQTINSQTTPFVTRDGLAPTAPYTNIWPLLPIKAYVSFTRSASSGAMTINSSFNVTSVDLSVTTYTVTMTNALRTTSYGIFLLTDNQNVPPFDIISTTQFSLVQNTATGTVFNVLVIEP